MIPDQNLARTPLLLRLRMYASPFSRLKRARRGVVAMEFALMSVPFFAFVLFVIELSYDLFTQSVLDNALQIAVTHPLARGNASNLPSGSGFIDKVLCPNFTGLLECNQPTTHIFVKVQQFPASSATDYYDITTGRLPMVGNTLDLSGYTSSTSFCNAGRNEFILVSVIYVGPTFVGYLLPNVISVTLPSTLGGGQAHATLSTVGVQTEGFTPGNSTGAAPSC